MRSNLELDRISEFELVYTLINNNLFRISTSPQCEKMYYIYILYIYTVYNLYI